MKNIILFFLLAISIAGCKKECKNISRLSDLQKNFVLKEGSYWVMRDSVSGQVDSFYIKSTAQYVKDFTASDDCFYSIEYYDILIKKVNTNTNIEDSLDYWINITSLKPEDIQFVISVYTGSLYCSNNFSPQAHLISITLFGKVYYNVSSSLPIGKIQTFMNTNEVIVKIRWTTASSAPLHIWELINAHLIK